LKRRENTHRERERERERKHVKENSKTEERGYIIFKFSPLLNKNRKEVINEEEEEEDGESPVKIPVRAEKDRRVPRGRGDG
jgi:hypothetical protein